MDKLSLMTGLFFVPIWLENDGHYGMNWRLKSPRKPGYLAYGPLHCANQTKLNISRSVQCMDKLSLMTGYDQNRQFGRNRQKKADPPFFIRLSEVFVILALIFASSIFTFFQFPGGTPGK